jgi:uncharacterized protein (TIGR02300 family)
LRLAIGNRPAPRFKNNHRKRLKVAKEDLGTKRTCPETGKKFYDLKKDPIVSPYTGIAYPLSAFEQVRREARIEDDEAEEVEAVASVDNVEFVPLEEADGDDKADGDDLPDLGDDDVDLGDDDGEDTFLETEEEEDDDMSDLLGGVPEGEDEV